MFSKIFSIGINLNGDFKLIYDFLKNNSNYIHSIFFGLPLFNNESKNSDFSPRHQQVSNPNIWEEIKALCNYCRTLDIKIDLVTNKVPDVLDKTKFEQLFFLINLIKPEEMTVVPELAFIINSYFPDIDLVYSYNAKPPQAADFNNPLYYSYAVAKNYLGNSAIGPENKELRFLINCGCPECGGCAVLNWKKEQPCFYLFDKYKNTDLNYYIANHIIFPRDIKLYFENFPTQNFKFKFGSRDGANLNQASTFILNYKNNVSNKQGVLDFSDGSYKPLVDAINKQGKDVDKILEYKQELGDKLVPGVKY